MPSSTRPSPQPLGGSSGDWPRRLVRFHVPLALASVLVLIVFMTLPPFDPQAYPQMNMGSPGALPQRMDMSSAASPSQQPGDGAVVDHGGSQTSPSTSHGGSGTPSPSGHGGSQTTPPAAHGSGPTPVVGHGNDQ